MTAKATALAHALIEHELSRIPESDRGEVASHVLGALSGVFLMVPRVDAVEEDATRAALAAMDVPGLMGARGRS